MLRQLFGVVACRVSLENDVLFLEEYAKAPRAAAEVSLQLDCRLCRCQLGDGAATHGPPLGVIAKVINPRGRCPRRFPDRMAAPNPGTRTNRFAHAAEP